MPLRVSVEEDMTRAGHALIWISGLDTMPVDRRFRLSREGYDQAQMGPAGWQVAESLLEPVEARQEGERLLLVAGPNVTQFTEAGPVTFALPFCKFESAVMWPYVDVVTAPPPPPATPPPPPSPAAPAAPASVPTPSPPSAAPSAQPIPSPPIEGSRVPRWLMLIVFFVIGAAAAAAWVFRVELGLTEKQQPVVSATPDQRYTTPPPPPAEASWLQRSDAMTLSDLVQSAPDAAAIHAAALRRQAAGRYDDALLLFEEAAERGHAPSNTALARLYDPVGFVPGRPFRSPDPRTAARYYRAAAAGDPAALTPRAALRQFLEEQRATNPTAAAALQEFWP